MGQFSRKQITIRYTQCTFNVQRDRSLFMQMSHCLVSLFRFIRFNTAMCYKVGNSCFYGKLALVRDYIFYEKVNFYYLSMLKSHITQAIDVKGFICKKFDIIQKLTMSHKDCIKQSTHEGGNPLGWIWSLSSIYFYCGTAVKSKSQLLQLIHEIITEDKLYVGTVNFIHTVVVASVTEKKYIRFANVFVLINNGKGNIVSTIMSNRTS